MKLVKLYRRRAAIQLAATSPIHKKILNEKLQLLNS